MKENAKTKPAKTVRSRKHSVEAMSALDRERLFGSGEDCFKHYHMCLTILNVLKHIGLRRSSDNDWDRSVAAYLTNDEIASFYDKLLPLEERRKRAQNMHMRTPPELGDDDPDDIISYLSRDLNFRKKMWTAVIAIYEKRVEQYRKQLADPDRPRSATEVRFAEMQRLFDLNDTEVRALVVIFLSTSSFRDLGDFDVRHYRNNAKIPALAMAMDMLELEAADLFSEKRNISKYGLVDEDLDLDRTFLSFLSGISSRPLSERFWTKYEGEILPWSFHGKLAEKQGAVLKDMIRAKTPDNGLSVLLYGVPGSGKSSFAVSLAHDMGKDLYFIAQNDNDNRRMSYSPAFRYAALAVAQKQLDPDKCILAVDECDKLVENTSLGGGILSFLGIPAAGGRDGESKGQLNSVIDENRHTILWICNSKQGAIDPSSRRRFDYNILFDDLTPTAREHIWRNALAFHHCEGKLTDYFLKRVSSRYAVNPGGIAVAVRNAAAVCAADPARDFEHETMTFLKAHCSLLGIAELPEDKLEPARDYSLEGLNIRSGIKLPRLIEVCRNFLKRGSQITADRDRPRMNLLLFGVPGSGKTEFVKYLAKQLDKKLLVKNASDLLNCYVGMTEQRIVQAFAEAEASGDILFIDEGDSMLAARENASRTWEVSQVNTLLTEMERFNGIFIVGTNFIQKLDQAAMRRFSFRLHFDYLTNEGKEIFFRTYFTGPLKLPPLSDEDRAALFAIESMTPSDFRNTRQQFFYLEDSDLTNREIIDALAAEIAGKTSGANYTGLGKIVSKMGF